MQCEVKTLEPHLSYAIDLHGLMLEIAETILPCKDNYLNGQIIVTSPLPKS
jgi:hypothetical protein